MTKQWIAWSDRNQEFAPIIGLHKHHLFFPTSAEAFIKSDCELVILDKLDPNEGAIFKKVTPFTDGSLTDKVQFMLNPKFNNRFSFLDRYSRRAEIKNSAELQRSLPKRVYVRGFRNVGSGEAYITYWCFFLENFVPHSLDDAEIADTLATHPDDWWTHEGDWEAVSLYFEDYQASDPARVFFSQHDDPETIEWADVEKQDSRVLTISALGSHANFNRPIRKKRFPLLPLVDITEIASPDILLYPDVNGQSRNSQYELEEFEPETRHLWLHFRGRWGQSGDTFSKAPTGPLMKKRKHFELLADRMN